MSFPLVSAVIPAYNCARFLPQAVESALAQQYPALELLIVDDGSTDATAEAADALARQRPDIIRAIHRQNGGPSAARNEGLRQAHGEFIAFLDADDLWPAEKLSVQLARMALDPALDVVLGRIEYRADEGAQLPALVFEPNQTITHVHLGSGIYRKRAFDRAGFFQESFRYCEDVDWFLRARETGLRMLILRRPTLIYRIHGGNMTADRGRPDAVLAHVLKSSLDRRRAAGAAGDLPAWSSYDESRLASPSISVVIPAANAERFLAEAVESAFAQSLRPAEIIVVDDGSTDDTAAVAHRFGPAVRLLRQPRAGPGPARNAGVLAATGDLIAFLDADDLWEPLKLERQVEAMRVHSVDIVFSHALQFVAASGGRREPFGSPAPFASASTMLARKEVFSRAGLFPADFIVGEFIEWFSRARAAGCSSMVVPGAFTLRRIHGDNLVIRERGRRMEYLRVLKSHLDRNRGTGSEKQP